MSIDKRTLLRRAYQLKSWNKKMTFGECLSLAWKEAKAGLCTVIVETRRKVLGDVIANLESRGDLGDIGCRRLRSLYREYDALVG